MALKESFFDSFDDMRGTYFTRAELKRRLGWSYKTLNKRIEANEFSTKQIGAVLYVSGTDIADYLGA